MRFYESGDWGFSLICGIEASVFPRSLVIALPNAIITFILATLLESEPGGGARQPAEKDKGYDTTDNALSLLAGFTSVMFFVLYRRSSVAYARWWEGGTLLQKTRGEWFNAYSSLMAFSSMDPKLDGAVEEFQHLLARLMSLLFCCGLQQVSPSKDRTFEIIDLEGIDPVSLRFLNDASDKVEVILQWIQRATVLHMQTGVLPVAPPVLSRAFQEVSRGIVNLQNARKIADFPFPFPYAQVSMVALALHWCFTPVACSMMFSGYHWHRVLAAAVAFTVVFFIWCINFIALQLEAPFGDRANDLPMEQMQQDWNQSLKVLLAKRAQRPPDFAFNQAVHRKLTMVMSDGTAPQKNSRHMRSLLESEKKRSRRSTFVAKGNEDAPPSVEVMDPLSLSRGSSQRSMFGHPQRLERHSCASVHSSPPMTSEGTVAVSAASLGASDADYGSYRSQVSYVQTSTHSDASLLPSPQHTAQITDIDAQVVTLEADAQAVPMGTSRLRLQETSAPSKTQSKSSLSTHHPTFITDIDLQVTSADSSCRGVEMPEAPVSEPSHQCARFEQNVSRSSKMEQNALSHQVRRSDLEEKLVENAPEMSRTVWEQQLRDVGVRMKELHGCLIDEELRLLASLTSRTVPEAELSLSLKKGI